jgi:hypothetical protein
MMEKATATGDSGLISMTQQIEQNVQKVIELLTDDRNYRDGFLKTLRSDFRLMHSISFYPDSLISTRKKLSYLAERYTLLTLQVSGKPYFEIEVTVWVYKKGKSVDGYEIGCRTLFYHNSEPMRYADSNRSPTKIYLSPGEYIFSLKKEGKKPKDYRRSIGSRNGDTKQKIEFEISNE